MSLNQLIHDIPKPWLNSGVKSMTVEGEFLYKERVAGDTLRLVRSVDGAALEANWQQAVPLVDIVYNNQVDLVLQTKTYSVANDTITYTGFKYASPSYYNLTADRKTLLISSAGTYFVICNFATYDLDRSSIFTAYLDGEAVEDSRVSFIPTRPVATSSEEQFTVCTTAFIIRTGGGITELQFKIVPTANNTIEGRGSAITVIKLSNFEPPP